MRRLSILSLAFACTFAIFSCKTKEEKLQDAEEEGSFLVQKTSKLIEGAGNALKDDGATAAESVTEGTGEVIKAITSGFDESLTKVTVELDEGLAEMVELGRAGRTGEQDDDGMETVSVYIIPNQDLKGTLTLKAFDKDGNEMGRSKYAVDVASDDAQYHDFKFDDRVPMMQIDRFSLSMD